MTIFSANAAMFKQNYTFNQNSISGGVSVSGALNGTLKTSDLIFTQTPNGLVLAKVDLTGTQARGSHDIVTGQAPFDFIVKVKNRAGGDFPYKDNAGVYDPSVILDLDCWLAMPR